MQLDWITEIGVPAPPARILVVEDYVPLVLTLRQRLESAGYAVDAVVGFRSLTPEESVGLWANRDVPIHLARYDVAFLDFYLLGNFRGIDVLRALLGAGPARCIGISSSQRANDEMIAAGAFRAIRKPDFIARIERDGPSF
ncbi:MAG: response regulator [Fimbriimonadaceae bacterium]|nr:response regulator [Fimbriimonadaceae bacterium]